MKQALLIPILLLSTLLGGNKIAITIKATGDVKYFPSGTKMQQPLKRGLGLVNEDRIRTGKNGFAVTMYLDDKTTIKVKENTEYIIGGQRAGNGINKRVSLNRGTMLASVSKQKGKEFIIATPVSVASVKGTEIVIISDPLQGDLFITLTGMVNVTNTITGDSTIVNAGETATSTPDGTLDVTQTESNNIPTFEEGEQEAPTHELRFEIEDANGNKKEVVIQYQ